MLVYVLRLGVLGTALGVLIAAAKAVLIAAIFMHLSRARASARIFALAGFLWLAVMVTLTLADYLTRN